MTWVICLAGTVLLFVVVPKAFLPIGDSSFIWGVMIGREGSSPEQMRALQDRADEVMRQDPSVGATFTLTGEGQFLASNQAIKGFCLPSSNRPRCARPSRVLQDA